VAIDQSDRCKKLFKVTVGCSETPFADEKEGDGSKEKKGGEREFCATVFATCTDDGVRTLSFTNASSSFAKLATPV
jgi:hypothetical protein